MLVNTAAMGTATAFASSTSSPSTTTATATTTVNISEVHSKSPKATLAPSTKPMNTSRSGNTSDCVTGNFAVCARNFENGGKGIELYKILNVNLAHQSFTGRRLRPAKPGVTTDNPSCLYYRWQTFGRQVECTCSSSLCYFEGLDDKKIPGAVIGQLVVLSDIFAEGRQSNAITPTKIVKTRLLGPSQEYLVTDEGGEYEWIPDTSPAACTLQFEHLLVDWKSARLPVQERNREPLVKSWCTIGPYRLNQQDSILLEGGGPLNQAIMDAVMTKLASLTRKFDMTPCLCPLEGYSGVDGDHVQVHHCGSYPHWVFSMRFGGIIWYGDYQGRSIPPSVVAEIVDLYSRDALDTQTDVRVLCLPAQQLTSTCGVLVLLAIVVVIVSVIQQGNADPTILCELALDEAEGGKWIQKMLTSTFPSLSDHPGTALPSKRSVTRKYHTLQIQPHVVARITQGLLRGSQVDPMPVVVGHGSPPISTIAHYRTAAAQAARLRLVTGCVIQTQTLAHAVGNWVITEVSQTRLLATPFNQACSDSKPPSLVLDLKMHPPVKFVVSGPPPMRSLRFSELSEYQTSNPTHLMFIYPVRQGRLSNTVFMTDQVSKYYLIEAEPCQDRFDVECLMKLMEGRSVRVHMRIEDLLPFRALVSYYPDVDATTVPDVYRQILLSLMQEHDVQLETDLFTPNVISTYPEEMSTEGKGLPGFHACALLEVRSRLRKSREDVGPVELEVPHIPGAVVVFQSATAQSATEWAVSLAETEHPDLTIPFPLRVRGAIDDTACLRVSVTRHNIARADAGLNLSARLASTLRILAKQIVRSIGKYANQKPCSLGLWSQLLDPVFGCYQLRLFVDSNGRAKVADVKGCDAAHDPSLSTISALQTTGLVAFGGQKLVLGGSLLQPQPTAIVLYKLRDATQTSAVDAFQSEINIWASMQDSNFVPRLLYRDSSRPMLWAVGEQLFGTVRQWLRVTSTPEEKLRVVASCAKALSNAHSRRLLHRDVKPGNFLYDSATHEAKLADFGLAMFLTDSNPHTAGNVGTLSFKAPEVFRGQYGLPADVFSFGVTMWELLAGKSRATLMRQQFDEKAKNNSQFSSYQEFVQYEGANLQLLLSSRWDQRVHELVAACTHKEPQERPAMDEVARRLVGCLSCAKTNPASTPARILFVQSSSAGFEPPGKKRKELH